MRGVAISDTHLGKVQFAATSEGRNVRERDVERAWFEAIAKAVDLQPDLLTIAGDVFEHPRVSAHAIKAYRDGLRQLAGAGSPVIVIQGNHDAARTTSILSPIFIPDDLPGVHVVDQVSRIRLTVASGERVAVTCVPFTALEPEERTWAIGVPDPDVDVNVLLIHAAVNTSADDELRLPTFYAGHDSLDVGKLAEAYDVVAAGDYHEFRPLHPERLAFYSGSLEFVSSDIWREDARKGFVLYDTNAGEMELVEVPTREVIDLQFDQLLGGRESTAMAVNEVLRDLVDDLGDGGQIVRLKVDHLPRSEKDAIDWAAVRALKEKALHFQLDVSYQVTEHVVGDRRDRAGRSLLDEAREYFADDEEPVRELALAHLAGGEAIDA